VLPIGRMVIDEYSKGTYRKALVAHTHFLSAINQRPTMLELLPFGGGEANGTNKTDSTGGTDYLFEPTPRGVLDKILPRLVETMVYQAVLESAASEHSARMMAMRSASDAAGEMIGALTFTFNQARQAGITQEIAEISSGKAALET
jgi:F-type H+-transporting ATPase subunit gamma